MSGILPTPAAKSRPFSIQNGEGICNQYEGEQEQLQGERDGYKTEQVQYENDRKSAARFLNI